MVCGAARLEEGELVDEVVVEPTIRNEPITIESECVELVESNVQKEVVETGCELTN